jgi:hypothetical protein
MFTVFAYRDNQGKMVIGPVDEHGQPVERTKQQYPYSYDGFVQWRDTNKPKANGTIYSDRLTQWDFPKYDLLCMKHFGNKSQYWDSREPEKIEAFLRDWCEDPELELTMVMEYCNVSNGYPCWRFDYFRKANVREVKNV